MATTYEADDYNEASLSLEKGVYVIHSQYTWAAAFVINDEIQGRKISKNTKILDGWVRIDDTDSNGTPLTTITFRINDETTQKNLFVASTIGQTGGVARMGDTTAAETDFDAAGYVVGNGDFRPELLIAAAPATGITTGQLDMFLLCTNALVQGEGDL